MSASDFTHIDYLEIVAESDKDRGAFLVRFKRLRSGIIEEAWIPYSMISDHEDYNRGDRNGTISVRTWWCAKENIP